jgi:hypothetical protein
MDKVGFTRNQSQSMATTTRRKKKEQNNQENKLSAAKDN